MSMGHMEEKLTREQKIYDVNMRYDPRFNRGMGLAPYEIATYERPHTYGIAVVGQVLVIVGGLGFVGWVVWHLLVK